MDECAKDTEGLSGALTASVTFLNASLLLQLARFVLVACDQNALSEEFCEEPGSYYCATGTIIIITRYSLRIYSEDRGLLKSKE